MRVFGAHFINNLKKRVFRIEFFLCTCQSYFFKLTSLKFEEIIKPQMGNVMYLCKDGLLNPNSFNEMFLLNCDVHVYNTRSKNSFRLPYFRTNVRKFSFRFQGPKMLIPLALKLRMPLVLL